jgi:hypothetical protein
MVWPVALNGEQQARSFHSSRRQNHLSRLYDRCARRSGNHGMANFGSAGSEAEIRNGTVETDCNTSRLLDAGTVDEREPWLD